LEYFISDMRACDEETEYVLIPLSFGRILVEGLGKRAEDKERQRFTKVGWFWG
jgi:hypothetical protein